MSPRKKNRVVLLAGLALCLLAAPVYPQSGSITPFGDVAGTSCNIVDTGGLVQIYIIYVFGEPIRGARFRLNVDDLGWFYLGETAQFQGLGNSMDGMTLCFGEKCVTAQILLTTVNFFGSAAAPCSRVPVEGFPDASIEALDCNLNAFNPDGGEAIVNVNATCDCYICRACAAENNRKKTTEPHFCATVPVESSTWGMIKSLYD